MLLCPLITNWIIMRQVGRLSYPLACENIRFSSLFAARDVSGETDVFAGCLSPWRIWILTIAGFSVLCMTAHRRITRVLCQEWGMDMGKRLAHFPTWLPLTAKHWVIFNGRFLFKEEILKKQEAAFELSSLGPGSIVGEKMAKTGVKRH